MSATRPIFAVLLEALVPRRLSVAAISPVAGAPDDIRLLARQSAFRAPLRVAQRRPEATQPHHGARKSSLRCGFPHCRSGPRPIAGPTTKGGTDHGGGPGDDGHAGRMGVHTGASKRPDAGPLARRKPLRNIPNGKLSNRAVSAACGAVRCPCDRLHCGAAGRDCGSDGGVHTRHCFVVRRSR
jgi:hypothetical protein